LSAMYYVLRKISGDGESWTFTTREKALEFLESRLCWGCKQDVRNHVVLEHNPEKDTLESIVIQDALDTHCGAEYCIETITQDAYRNRAEKALNEITKIFESSYQEHNEDLPQENEQPNRVD